MKLLIRYKDPIPDKMRSLYERAFKIIFGKCRISWWNPKIVQILDIKEIEIEIQEDN